MKKFRVSNDNYDGISLNGVGEWQKNKRMSERLNECNQ